MDSPPITQGHSRRPKKDWPKAKKSLAEGQSPPQELEVSPRSGLYLLVTVYIKNQHKSATFDGISTKIVTDSGPSIKRLIGGLIRDAPNPPNPPYGGLKYFWWVMTERPC